MQKPSLSAIVCPRHRAAEIEVTNSSNPLKQLVDFRGLRLPSGCAAVARGALVDEVNGPWSEREAAQGLDPAVDHVLAEYEARAEREERAMREVPPSQIGYGRGGRG